MTEKELAPYLVPLLVAALLARRIMRSREPRVVRPGRLWIFPAILLIAAASTLAKEPWPGFLVLAGYIAAAGAGATLGWFRVHTLEFSIDSETGAVMSKSTPLGAFLIVGLLLGRYALKYVLNDAGMTAASLIRWTDGGLLFSCAMMVAQSAHTWVRARKLMDGAAAKPVHLTESDP